MTELLKFMQTLIETGAWVVPVATVLAGLAIASFYHYILKFPWLTASFAGAMFSGAAFFIYYVTPYLFMSRIL